MLRRAINSLACQNDEKRCAKGDECDGRAKRPIKRDEVFLDRYVAHNCDIRATKDSWCHERTGRDRKHNETSREDTRRREWNRDTAKRVQRIRTECRRGELQLRIDRSKALTDWDYHEDQERVNKTKDDGGIGVEQLDWPVS